MTPDDRARCDAVADFEVCDTLANFNHPTRHFMANQYRRLHTSERMRPFERNVKGPSHVLMEIRSAYAAQRHLNLNLAGSRTRRLLNMLDAYVTTPVPDCSLHVDPFSASAK